MAVVRIRDNEPPEVSLRRFKRACEKDGILTELRSREFYEPPSVARQRAEAAAVKRHLKKKEREKPKREDHQ